MLRFSKYAQLHLQKVNGGEVYVHMFDHVLIKHNLSTEVQWTEADEAKIPAQLEIAEHNYSEKLADSISTNLARIIDKYTDDSANAVSVDFARAYLLYSDAISSDLGTD